MKRARASTKRASRKSAPVRVKTRGASLNNRPVVVSGMARDALNIFRGGVQAALQGLSMREVAVMVKTSNGTVVGVPVVKNGVVVSFRTNGTGSARKSGSTTGKR
jgi:hypothetical protein